jgi:hypothetical protein
MEVLPMPSTLPSEIALGLAGVPLLVALTEATKLVAPELQPRFHPLVALAWGLLLTVGVGAYLGADPVLGAVTGLVAALAAVGLYSGGRAVVR